MKIPIPDIDTNPRQADQFVADLLERLDRLEKVDDNLRHELVRTLLERDEAQAARDQATQRATKWRDAYHQITNLQGVHRRRLREGMQLLYQVTFSAQRSTRFLSRRLRYALQKIRALQDAARASAVLVSLLRTLRLDVDRAGEPMLFLGGQDWILNDPQILDCDDPACAAEQLALSDALFALEDLIHLLREEP